MALGEIHLHPALVDQRPAVVGLLPRRPLHDVLVERDGQTAPRGQADALVVELRGDHPPALVLVPDAVGDGHVHVVIEGLRRRQPADGVDDRPLEADRGRGHAQDRDALVLGNVRVGPHGQPHVVGLVGAAGEDLCAVDDVLLPVAHCPRAQRGQVGTGLGLGVADGEVELTCEDLRQEERLLLVGAEAHDGRPDGVDGDEGERRTGAPGLVEEDELVRRRPALAAELARPSDAEPAVLADLAHHLAPGRTALAALGETRPHLVGEELAVVLTQLGAQLLLFGALFEEHRGAASRVLRGPCQVKAALENCNTFSFTVPLVGPPPGSAASRSGGRTEFRRPG